MRPIERSCLLLVPALLLAAAATAASQTLPLWPASGTLLQSRLNCCRQSQRPLCCSSSILQPISSCCLLAAPRLRHSYLSHPYTTVAARTKPPLHPRADGAYRCRCELHWCASDRLVRACTTTDRAFNIATCKMRETLLLAALFASQGYIVSRQTTPAMTRHACLPSVPDCRSAIEGHDRCTESGAYRAAARICTLTKIAGSCLLPATHRRLRGMATHRAMQTAGMKVTASVPMSAVWLAAVVDAVFYGEVMAVRRYVTFLLTAIRRLREYLRQAVEVFEPQYALASNPCCQHDAQKSAICGRKLPQYALFSLTPPAAEFADITPPTAPANWLRFSPSLWQRQFDPEHLSAQLPARRADHRTGDSDVTTGTAAAAPELPWRQALQRNDFARLDSSCSRCCSAAAVSTRSSFGSTHS